MRFAVWTLMTHGRGARPGSSGASPVKCCGESRTRRLRAAYCPLLDASARCCGRAARQCAPTPMSVLARALPAMPLVTPPPPEYVRILNDHPVPRHWEYRPRLRVRARVEWETGTEYRVASADRYSRTGL